jgi:hypothetical protein
MIPILLVAFIMSWSASLWAGDSYSCGSHPMLTSTKEDGSEVGLIISPDQISKTPE